MRNGDTFTRLLHFELTERALSCSYVIDESVRNTGISFFAIFDGHGGEYAAVFARDHLIENLYKKIEDASDIITGKVPPPSPMLRRANCPANEDNEEVEERKDTVKENLESGKLNAAQAQRRSSFKKSLSTTDDCNGAKSNCNREEDVFLNKLNAIVRTKDSFLRKEKNAKPQQFEARCYIDKDRKINFGKLVTDEVLAADYKLVERAKKEVIGTRKLCSNPLINEL